MAAIEDRDRARAQVTGRMARATRLPSRWVLAAICTILIATGAALVQTFGAEREARVQIERTTEVLKLLRVSLRTGLDAETGQRGFLLTGEQSYLAPYLSAQVRWPRVLADLRRALEGDATPSQIDALDELDELASEKLSELALTVALARSGQTDEALAVVRSDEGQRLMEAYRLLVAELEDEEEAILDAALGRAAAVEGQAMPLLAFLAVATLGLVVLGLFLERRTARAERRARDADALHEARQRSDLLARELNHRVKNLFAVILSIVSLSARGESDAKALAKRLRERIHALSVAHAVTQGQLDMRTAPLSALVEAAVSPHAGADRFTAEGPGIDLPARAVTPLGLVLHELATNAAKYGALSLPEGRVDVTWTSGREGDDVRLVWRESGGPAVRAPEAEGFGSMMIRQSVAQLGGRVERDWREGGLRAEIVLPDPALDP